MLPSLALTKIPNGFSWRLVANIKEEKFPFFVQGSRLIGRLPTLLVKFLKKFDFLEFGLKREENVQKGVAMFKDAWKAYFFRSQRPKTNSTVPK